MPQAVRVILLVVLVAATAVSALALGLAFRSFVFVAVIVAGCVIATVLHLWERPRAVRLRPKRQRKLYLP
jgi:hypothetical protein